MLNVPFLYCNRREGEFPNFALYVYRHFLTTVCVSLKTVILKRILRGAISWRQIKWENLQKRWGG